MDVQALKKLRGNLDHYVKEFDACIKTAPSRKHLRTYVAGQISDLDRKSVEPIALDAGVPPRTLQEFLEIHKWDQDKVCRRVQELIMRDHGSLNAIAMIDETGYPKKGDKTAGVQRQYCGATGKKDNCVISVDLGYVSGDFHSLADSDLYLPEKTWHENRGRCRTAGIPDGVVYRPKWKIALELLERSTANGMRFQWLAADELYGRCSDFRKSVAGMGLTYVMEVPCNTRGWTQRPRIMESKPHSGRGRPRTQTRLSPTAKQARRVDRLWKRGAPSWEAYHIKDTEKGPAVWEVRACRFFVAEDDLPSDEGWVIIARNVLEGETKYFLSNAPKECPVEMLLHVAFSRWRIERCFEDAKGQVGLDHFEVQHYLPLMRHLVLSRVSMLFLMKETERLGKKKSLVERASGPHGDRGAA